MLLSSGFGMADAWEPIYFKRPQIKGAQIHYVEIDSTFYRIPGVAIAVTFLNTSFFELVRRHLNMTYKYTRIYRNG